LQKALTQRQILLIININKAGTHSKAVMSLNVLLRTTLFLDPETRVAHVMRFGWWLHSSTPLELLGRQPPYYFTCYIAHIGDGRYENKKARKGFFYV
tara:strand:+ start:2095 stop:2385 length:291 start_codon:yes stop_codon:yes gene_type:complete